MVAKLSWWRRKRVVVLVEVFRESLFMNGTGVSDGEDLTIEPEQN